MPEKPRVLLIVTQDTKKIEGAFLRDCLEEAGCEVIHLDPSVRQTVGGAEIGPDEVAAAAGKSIEEIRAIGHEGKIQLEMIAGATKLAGSVANSDTVSKIGLMYCQGQLR